MREDEEDYCIEEDAGSRRRASSAKITVWMSLDEG